MTDQRSKTPLPTQKPPTAVKPKKGFLQAIGATRQNELPPEKTDIKCRPDRIGKYFKKYLNKFIFVEFSKDFLKGTKIEEFMTGVPIPLRKRDVKEFAGGKGLMPNHLAENMAWVMGSDPQFKYNDAYVKYMLKMFNNKIVEQMLKMGRDAAEAEDFDNACIHFRACLCVNPTYMHAMYSYAKVCRNMYEKSGNKEYVGRFKAESMSYFELLTEVYPRFAQAYYYLGYAYLNIGLYGKANAAWKIFLKLSKTGKDIKEIRNRMEQIKDPMRIEEGYTEILAARYENGIEILEPFLERKYKDWWPLHYYLGVAYSVTGRKGEAVARFKNVLALNGSHLETMEELLSIYRSQGDKENIAKYENKIKLIRADLEREQDDLEEYDEDSEYAAIQSDAVDAPLADSAKSTAEGSKKTTQEPTPKQKKIKRLK